jgi:hypothetical protein
MNQINGACLWWFARSKLKVLLEKRIEQRQKEKESMQVQKVEKDKHE